MLDKSGGAKGSINSSVAAVADAIAPEISGGTSSHFQPLLACGAANSKARMTILPQVKMQIGYSNFLDLSGCKEPMSSSLSQRGSANHL